MVFFKQSKKQICYSNMLKYIMLALLGCSVSEAQSQIAYDVTSFGSNSQVDSFQYILNNASLNPSRILNMQNNITATTGLSGLANNITDITIQSSGLGSPYTLDGNGKSGSQLGAGKRLTLKDLIVKNFSKSSGGFFSLSANPLNPDLTVSPTELTIDNVDFTDNTASSSGGVFQSGQGGYLNITTTSSSFKNNTAVSGGAMSLSGSVYDLSFKDTDFINNTASESGGALNFSGAKPEGPYLYEGKISLDNVDFKGNKAIGGGGGAFVFNNGLYDITWKGGEVSGNSAGGRGGAAQIRANTIPAGRLFISDVSFSNNSGIEFGGAVSVSHGNWDVTIENSSFSNNYLTRPGVSTVYGGALGLDDLAALSMNGDVNNTGVNSIIKDNTVHRTDSSSSRIGGGGIYLKGNISDTETASISNYDFIGNTVTGGGTAAIGGGIFNEMRGILTLSNTNFSNNTAVNIGGAIFNAVSSIMNLKDENTFINNFSNDRGSIANDGILNITGIFKMSNPDAQSLGWNNGSGIHNTKTLNITGKNSFGSTLAKDFDITDDWSAVFKDNSIKDSAFAIGSAIYSGGSNSSFSLDSVWFNNNNVNKANIASPRVNGGVISVGASTVASNIKNSFFSNNTMDIRATNNNSSLFGSVISVSGTLLNIDNSKFLNNRGFAHNFDSDGLGNILVSPNGTIALLDSNAKLNVTNSWFEGNISQSSGNMNTDKFIHNGGSVFYNDSTGTTSSTYAKFSDTTFLKNRLISIGSLLGGGVLSNIRGNIELKTTNFIENSTEVDQQLNGGIIANVSRGSDNILDIDNSVFSANKVVSSSSYIYGGIIANGVNNDGLSKGAATNISNSKFVDNIITAKNGIVGGVIHNLKNTMTISNTIFENNTNSISSGSILGGAIYQSQGAGAMSLTNIAATGSKATDGGVLYNEDTTHLLNISSSSTPVGGYAIPTNAASLTQSVFRNNSANSRGGVIYNSGSMKVAALFDTNSATAGGAIYNATNTSVLDVSNSIFSENIATTGGGAISNEGTMTITDSIFNANKSDITQGGAIYNTGTMTITDSIFKDNTAYRAQSGAIYSRSDTGKIYIVSQNKNVEFQSDTDSIYTTNDLYLNALHDIVLNGNIEGSSPANLYMNTKVTGKAYGTSGNIVLNSTLSGFTSASLGNGTLSLGDNGNFGLAGNGINFTMGANSVFNATNGVINKIYIKDLTSNGTAFSDPTFNFDLDFKGAVADTGNPSVNLGTNDTIILSGTQTGTFAWDSFQILNAAAYLKPTDFQLISGGRVDLDKLKVVQGSVDTENKTFKIIQNPGTKGNNWIRLVNETTPYLDPLRGAIYLTRDMVPFDSSKPGENAQFIFVLDDAGKIINYEAGKYLTEGTNNVANMPIQKLTRTPETESDYVSLTISGYIAPNYLAKAGNTSRDSTLDASSFALLKNESILNIKNVTIKNAKNNNGFDNGTAIYNEGRLDTNNVLFTNNQSVDGGAIYNANLKNPLLDLDVNLIDTDFVSNKASNDGGAFYNKNGAGTAVTFTNSKFTSNTSGDNGGAIYNAADANMEIYNTTFLDNTSDKLGEAIYNAGTMSITDSVFNFTTAGDQGSETIYNVGTLNLNTQGSNALFDGNTKGAINNSNVVNVNVANGYNMTFNNAIQNSILAKFNTFGDINLNSNLLGGIANLNSGIFNVSSLGDINVAQMNLDTTLKIDTTSAKTITSLGDVVTKSNAVIDMKNDHTGDKVNMNSLTGNSIAGKSGVVNLDIDFKDQSSDKINVQNTASGDLVVSSINILNEPDYNSMDPTVTPPTSIDRMDFNIMNGADLSGLNLSTLTAGSSYTNYNTSYTTRIENTGTRANLVLEKATTNYTNPLENVTSLANLYNKGWILNVNSDISPSANTIALDGTLFVVGNGSSVINGAGNTLFNTNIGSKLNIINANIKDGIIENNGTLSVSDSSFNGTNIKNISTDAIKVVTVNKDTIFNNAILDGNFDLSGKNGHNVVLENDFKGTGNLTLADNIKITGDASQYAGIVTSDNANMSLDGGKFFGGDFIVNGGSLSLVNSDPSKWNPYTLNTSRFSFNKDLNVIMNVDLLAGTSDKFTGTPIDTTGKINLSGINLLSNKTGESKFEIADISIKDFIKLDQNVTIMNSIYNYNVSYSDSTGILSFLSTGIDDDVEGSVAGGQTIGVLGALRTYSNVFKHANKLSTVGSKKSCDPYQRYWVEGGSDWDKVDLRNGPNVSGDMQNITMGVDSSLRGCGEKSQTYSSLYVGSITSDQKFDGNTLKGTGGYAGIMGTHIMNNWVNSITLNSGYTSVDTNASKQGFDLYNVGLAVKSGYNIPFNKYILTPSLQTGYIHLFSSSYTTYKNVNIEKDSFGNIHLKPELKLSAELDDNFSPYISVSYIYQDNVSGAPRAEGISLPESQIDSYFEYKLGLEKAWNEKISAYFEGALRSGGIEGGSLSMGLSYAF